MGREDPHQSEQGCSHRSHQGPQLLPVSLDFSLQDVVFGHLLFQLCHPRPILALTDQLLQRSQILSPSRRSGSHSPESLSYSIHSMATCARSSSGEAGYRGRISSLSEWQLLPMAGTRPSHVAIKTKASSPTGSRESGLPLYSYVTCCLDNAQQTQDLPLPDSPR